MRKSMWVLVIALALGIVMAAALVGCTSSGTGTGGTTGGGYGGGNTPTTSTGGGVTISEKNFKFDPSTATAKVGDTVTFTNDDSTDHQVVVGTTDLGLQAPGATVTWTADKAGTFPIKCTIHPAMTGEITVQ